MAVLDTTGANGEPHGKQTVARSSNPGGIMYTPCSGIWQTVWLEPVPAASIESLMLTPDVDAGKLRRQGRRCAARPTGCRVEAVALDGEREVARVPRRLRPPCSLVLKIPARQALVARQPFLYDLKVSLVDGGQTVDAVESYFGMRKIALGKDAKGFTRMLLNGKFVFQSGPLDQGFWPDGIYTAPTDEALRYDIEITKKLGFNMARKHVKIEPERWYYWCDKLGLLVWQDMPSGGGGKAYDGSKAAGQAARTSRAARRGRSVPAITTACPPRPRRPRQFEAELRAMVAAAPQPSVDHPVGRLQRGLGPIRHRRG